MEGGGERVKKVEGGRESGRGRERVKKVEGGKESGGG